MNVKINKFKELEVRQEKLMEEMENTIGVYLVEMKEENDRFISQLSNIKTVQQPNPQTVSLVESRNENSAKIDVQNGPSVQEELEQLLPNLDNIKIVPKTVAKNAYNRQKELPKSQQEQQNVEEKSQNVAEEKQQTVQQTTEYSDQTEKESETFEEKILSLHKEGKTIEEIAKMTQKGKTEIELLLKFHT